MGPLPGQELRLLKPYHVPGGIPEIRKEVRNIFQKGLNRL